MVVFCFLVGISLFSEYAFTGPEKTHFLKMFEIESLNKNYITERGGLRPFQKQVFFEGIQLPSLLKVPPKFLAINREIWPEIQKLMWYIWNSSSEDTSILLSRPPPDTPCSS